VNDEEARQRGHAYLQEAGTAVLQAAEDCLDDLVEAASIIAGAITDGGKLLICGNGGSAADSQHLAAEFVGTLDKRRPRGALPALSLTTDASILTAIGNDFGFEGVFERQVEALGRPGDVLIGITTSGDSENIVRALARAREGGLRTVVLTGRRPGRVGEHADVQILVPADDVGHIQEAHVAMEHALATLVERALTDG